MSATTSSKPGGVRFRAISMTASGCLGAKRILVAMEVSSLSLLLKGNGRRHARHAPVDFRGVPLPRGVLDQPGVAGAEDVLGAVAQPDLEPTRENDDELTARGRMPVLEVPGRAFPEGYLRGGQPLAPIRSLGQGNGLDMGLPVGACIKPEQRHDCRPPRVGVENVGIVARGEGPEPALKSPRL